MQRDTLLLGEMIDLLATATNQLPDFVVQLWAARAALDA